MIISSAIKFYQSNDELYPIIMTGLRHPNILEKIFRLGIQYNKDTMIEGFLIDKNQFLNRYEAKEEAQRCNQIVSDDCGMQLYSEDVWLD